MGFIKKNEIIAKITPSGKRKLIKKDIETLITKFGVGDSDANYYTNDKLDDNIVDISGNSNTMFFQNNINNLVINNSNSKFKLLNDDDKYMVSYIQNDDFKTSFKYKPIIVDRLNENSNNNLLKSINAPITTTEIGLYNFGVYAKNTYNGFYSEKYAIIPLDYNGDIIDGNDLKITLDKFELFSSLPNTTENPDITVFDDSNLSTSINTNMVLLFSDSVTRPISGGNWSDGHLENKPYSNGKKLFDPFTENENGFGDKMVGFVLLDKGLIVIINDDIIKTIQNKEINVDVEGITLSDYLAYEVVCNINRNDFTLSTNTTYNDGDAIRVSEIGLYDEFDDLIAIAKMSEHIVLDRTKPLTLSISINF